MVIGGEWLLFDDGIFRPIIRGEILSGDDSWAEIYFLVDTGADRTVFNAAVLTKLNLPFLEAENRIGGVGGLVNSVTVETQIRLLRENGNQVAFRGKYAAVTELEALDFCVLGRDILDNFAVIVDFPQEFIGLIRQNHIYRIERK